MKRVLVVIIGFVYCFLIYACSSYATTLNISCSQEMRGVINIHVTATFDTNFQTGKTGGKIEGINGYSLYRGYSDTTSTASFDIAYDTTELEPGETKQLSLQATSWEGGGVVTDSLLVNPDNAPTVSILTTEWRGYVSIEASYSFPSSKRSTGSISLYIDKGDGGHPQKVTFNPISLSSTEETSGTVIKRFDTTNHFSSLTATAGITAEAAIYHNYGELFSGSVSIDNTPIVNLLTTEWRGITSIRASYSFPSSSYSCGSICAYIQMQDCTNEVPIYFPGVNLSSTEEVSGVVTTTFDTTKYYWASGTYPVRMAAKLSSKYYDVSSETVGIDNTIEAEILTHKWRGVTDIDVSYKFPTSRESRGSIRLYVKEPSGLNEIRFATRAPLLEDNSEASGVVSCTYDTTRNFVLPGNFEIRAEARIIGEYQDLYSGVAKIDNTPIIDLVTTKWRGITDVSVCYSFPSSQYYSYGDLKMYVDRSPDAGELLISLPSVRLSKTSESVGNVVKQIDTVSSFPSEVGIYPVRIVAKVVGDYQDVYSGHIKVNNAPPTTPDPEKIAPKEKCTHENDPINVATGNMYTTVTDFDIPAQGLPLGLSRTYNSRDDYEGLFGFGWRSTYEYILSEQLDGAVIEIDADGVYKYFFLNDDDTYSASVGNFDSLVKNTDGSFTITRKHGTVYDYSAEGQLTSITDRNGNSLSLAYDSANVLESVTHSNGKVLTFTKNASGRIETVADPMNRTVTYTYDSNGDLINVQDQMSNNVTYAYTDHNMTTKTDKNGTPRYFTYDAEDRATAGWQTGDNNRTDLDYSVAGQTTCTDSLNNVTVYEYNQYGLVHTVTDANGKKEYTGWDDALNKTYFTDKNGHTTEFDYDAKGNLTQVTDPKTAVTSFTYDTQYHQVLTMTDAYQKVTSYTYDNKGNLLTVTDPLNNTTTNTYDAAGNILTTQDPLGNETTFTYDAYGNLTKVKDALNNETDFTYDLAGNILTTTDALNNTTTFVYDDLNRNTQITYPDTTSVSFTYDAEGNKLSATDAKSQTTVFDYDAFGRMSSISNPLSESTSYTYDTEGNQLTLVDANNHSTTYTYDGLFRLLSETIHLNKTTTYTYDDAGNIATKQDAKQNAITYTYDERNQLTQITYPDSTTINFTYDSLGRKVTMVDSRGTTTYAYDDLSRVTSVDGPLTNDTIQYEYNALGSRIRMIDHDGNEILYAYDALNRLNCLTASGGNVTTFTYNELSKLQEITYPNGTSATYTYDSMGRVTNLTNSGNTLTSFAYQYDPNGMRTTATVIGEATIQYEYDGANRLIREARERLNTQDVNIPRYVYEYEYGALGNRIKMRRMHNRTNFWNIYASELPTAVATYLNGNNYAEGSAEYSGDFETEISGVINRPIIETNYIYNADNQLTTLSENLSYSGTVFDIKGVTNAYDDNGNLLMESLTRSGTSQVTDYVYDYENRLTEIKVNNVTTFNAVYDGAGKRIQTTDSGVTTNYLYDGLSSIIERNPSGVTTKLFTRIPGNAGGISGLISMDTPLDTSADKFNSKTMFYHYDAIGNVVSMSGANGAQHAKYVNEAFGNQLQSTGTWTTANQYEFSTKQKDTTGLIYYGARYYNPQIGRWITKDPMKMVDGPNMYAFVGNNPVSFVDAWGFDSVAIYHGSDKTKGWRSAKGQTFRRAAQKYDHAINVDSSLDAANKLEVLKGKGVLVEELHIYDHGWPGAQELGNEAIEPTSKSWQRIGDAVSAEGEIYCHGCETAKIDGALNGDQYVQALANNANRPVNARTGITEYRLFGFLEHGTGNKVRKEPQNGC